MECQHQVAVGHDIIAQGRTGSVVIRNVRCPDTSIIRCRGMIPVILYPVGQSDTRGNFDYSHAASPFRAASLMSIQGAGYLNGSAHRNTGSADPAAADCRLINYPCIRDGPCSTIVSANVSADRKRYFRCRAWYRLFAWSGRLSE